MLLALLAGGGGRSFADDIATSKLSGPCWDALTEGAVVVGLASASTPNPAPLVDVRLLELPPPEQRSYAPGFDLPAPRDSAEHSPISARPPPR